MMLPKYNTFGGGPKRFFAVAAGLAAVVGSLLIPVAILSPAARASGNWQEVVVAEWGGHLRGGFRVRSVDERTVLGSVRDGAFVDLETDFRLKNNTHFGDIYSFEGHYEAVLSGGDTRETASILAASSGGSLPNPLLVPPNISDNSSLLNLSGVIDAGSAYIAYHRIDRLAVAARPDWGSAVLGRQALTWGNGLIFNPMDLFNPFRPTDMERDYKIGEDMALLQISNEVVDDIQMVYVPRRDLLTGEVSRDASTLAAKLHQTLVSMDIDLMAAFNYGDFVSGVGASGALGGAGWRFDATWTQPGENRSGTGFFECVANTDYAWNWQAKNIYGLLEFYYNSSGKTDYAEAFSDSETLNRLVRGERFTLGKYYLAGRLQVEVHPLVNLYLAVINNLADPSGTVQPRLEWSLKQNVQVVFSGTAYYGGTGTEYVGFYIPQYNVWSIPAGNAYCRVSLFF